MNVVGLIALPIACAQFLLAMLVFRRSIAVATRTHEMGLESQMPRYSLRARLDVVDREMHVDIVVERGNSLTVLCPGTALASDRALIGAHGTTFEVGVPHKTKGGTSVGSFTVADTLGRVAHTYIVRTPMDMDDQGWHPLDPPTRRYLG